MAPVPPQPLDPAALVHRLQRLSENRSCCLAMYSSWFGGIVTDPGWMLIPADDHLVQRGDGVFETMKCVAGALYNLEAHLRRLRTSASGIGLPIPADDAELTEICRRVAAAARRDCQIKLMVSRGPGSLSVSPEETVGSQIYVVAAELPPPFHRRNPCGARAVTVDVSGLISPRLARLKTCNYLPNVLMKQEALSADADFPIGVDESGRVTEGATESIAAVTGEGYLAFPADGRILPGTTAARVAELAETLVKEKVLAGIRKMELRREDLYAAREVMALGTTIDVAPVVLIDGRPVGEGRPGAVALRLAALLERDILSNRRLRTPIPG